MSAKSKMASNHRKKKRESGWKDAVSLVTALSLVVIAVLMVIFVYMYIKDSSGIFSFFNSDKKPETEVSAASEEESTGEELGLDLASEHYGLISSQEGIYYVLTPSEAALWDEDEKLKTSDGYEILSSTWAEVQHQLYHFDEKGHAATGNMSEGAMNYTFGDDGALQRVMYNPGYRPDPSSVSADYPGLVQTKTVWAYLNESKKLGQFSAIMYKKTTESLSHALGGNSNPQYSSPYTMSIHDGYIYYLAQSNDDPGGILDAINNKLFRMKPGTDVRELAAENVRGYKVIRGENGNAVVYWYDGDVLHRTEGFTEDHTVVSFPEDGNYYVDLDYNPGHATLMLEGGHPVTMESDSFTAGNFVYRLSQTGEILSVAPKTSISTGGYKYSFESGDAFGSTRSRLLRESAADGTIELISSEFYGTTGNMHYDYATGEMFAEFKDADGFSGILRFNKDGDIDFLQDATGVDGGYEIYAIQDNSIIAKRTHAGAVSFVKLRARMSTPIAVAIAPVLLEEDDPDTSTVIDGGEETAASGSDVAVLGPGGSGDGPAGISTPPPTKPGPGPTDPETTASEAQDYDTAVAGEAPTEAPQDTEVVEGPGGSAEQAAVISEQTVEQVGPGGAPEVGGMP